MTCERNLGAPHLLQVYKAPGVLMSELAGNLSLTKKFKYNLKALCVCLPVSLHPCCEVNVLFK